MGRREWSITDMKADGSESGGVATLQEGEETALKQLSGLCCGGWVLLPTRPRRHSLMDGRTFVVPL